MSRATGRRGGGRSKAGSSRTARIGGVEIQYDDGIDEHLKTRAQPTPLFPSYTPAQPKPLNRTEQDEVAKFIRIRDRFRNSPMYAKIGAAEDAPKLNPFEGMGSYSQKYIRRERTLPLLNTRTRVPEQFPKELHGVLGAQQNATNGVSKSKRAVQRQSTNPDRINMDEVDDEDDAEDNADEEGPEEELDDQYDSDESEMAGDYNAEQYFDNGGEEAGDDYEGDGGDGGDVFN